MIESEMQFFWKLIKDILILPLTLILVISKKKRASELFRPIKDFLKFLFEPKFAVLMALTNIIVFFYVNYLLNAGMMDETFFVSHFLFRPTDIFNIVPFVGAWFMHASLAHLFGNMLVLLIMGRVVERRVGFIRTAIIYFGAGIISNVFSAIINLFVIGNPTGGLGASGCISGLVAAAILLDPFYISFETIIPLPIILTGFLFMFSDVTGIISGGDNIGHLAHIGGFLSVSLAMFFLGKENKLRMKRGLFINLLTFVIIAIIYFKSRFI